MEESIVSLWLVLFSFVAVLRLTVKGKTSIIRGLSYPLFPALLFLNISMRNNNPL